MTTPHQEKETRERIFAAAARLFAERGYAAVSMREIAEAAGVSKPMLYYYFESKLGLCRALLEEGIERMDLAIRQIAAEPISIVEKLRTLVRMRFQYIRENPALVKFYLDFFHGPDETGLVEEYHARLYRALRMSEKLIADGQAKGELRADVDPRVATLAFVGAMNAYVIAHIREGTPPLDDALADMLVDIFLNGMHAHRMVEIPIKGTHS